MKLFAATVVALALAFAICPGKGKLVETPSIEERV